MEEVATITFKEAQTNNGGVAIIRRGNDAVAICLSIEGNGDIDVVMSRDDAQRLLNAIRTAVN